MINFYKKWQHYRNLINLRLQHIVLLLMMTLVSTFSEMLGLGLFYPIFQYINADGNVDLLLLNSKVWSYILSFISFIGMEISLAILLFFFFIINNKPRQTEPTKSKNRNINRSCFFFGKVYF